MEWGGSGGRGDDGDRRVLVDGGMDSRQSGPPPPGDGDPGNGHPGNGHPGDGEEVLYADPATAVQEIAAWRAWASEGRAIGGDPYSAYASEGGRLPGWPLAAVLAEARMARRFVEEIVGAPYAGLRLAGRDTICADGDFLEALRRQEGAVAFAVNEGAGVLEGAGEPGPADSPMGG